MENIMEFLYDLPRGKVYGHDSPFVKAACIKVENMDMLLATMTDQQKELLEAYFDADTQTEEIAQFDRFRYAFHLGAQLMAEIIQGKEDL